MPIGTQPWVGYAMSSGVQSRSSVISLQIAAFPLLSATRPLTLHGLLPTDIHSRRFLLAVLKAVLECEFIKGRQILVLSAADPDENVTVEEDALCAGLACFSAPSSTVIAVVLCAALFPHPSVWTRSPFHFKCTFPSAMRT